MVEVKELTKVKTGTVVKIDLDDNGRVRVTKGNTPWVDLDEEDEDEEDDYYEENYDTSAASASSATQVTGDEDDSFWNDPNEPQPCSFPVYQPKEIEYKGKKYTFKEPLDCKVLRGTGVTSYCIEYDPFDIWGTGHTWEEAVDFFNFQFASTYDWLNEFGEERVGHVYLNLLKLMNEMVIKVE
jgi:hypothetical protein